jgi:hypothetical protein
VAIRSRSARGTGLALNHAAQTRGARLHLGQLGHLRPQRYMLRRIIPRLKRDQRLTRFLEPGRQLCPLIAQCRQLGQR